MDWFLLATLTALLNTIQNLVMRVMAVKSQDPRAFSFVYSSWAIVFSILLVLVTKPVLDFRTILSFPTILFILIAVILYGLFERIQFFARKHIEASTINILFRLAPVTTFILSILFLKEAVTVEKIFGMVLILLAALLVTEWKGSIINRKAFLTALACAVFLGVAWTFDKIVSEKVHAATYNLILWTLPLIIIYVPSIPVLNIQKELTLGKWVIPVVAFLNVIGFYTQMLALSLADASRVIPIATSHVVLVVLGGMIFLHETSFFWKKLLAGCIVFIGIILMR